MRGKEILMVQIRNLQKSYKKFRVLDGLDMTINYFRAKLGL